MSRHRGTGVIVIGDDAFRDFVDGRAARSRLEVVGHLALAPEGDDPVYPVPDRRAWRDLIIDARDLDRARVAVPALLDDARRIWVVSYADRARGDHPRRHRTFGNPLPVFARAFKRSVDIVAALLGLVLCLPVLLVAMAAVRLDSAGGPIFSQTRVGADGRRFRLYKIRTMVANADDAQHRAYFAALARGEAERQDGVYKLVNDPRVTRVGRILRRLSIDELPQLWNVVRGHMSLVGPRPLLPADLDLYDAHAWQRLRVKPGITGLWQVSGRCELSFAEMVALDVRYWRNWSLRLEMSILLRTPKTVFAGKGAA